MFIVARFGGFTCAMRYETDESNTRNEGVIMWWNDELSYFTQKFEFIKTSDKAAGKGPYIGYNEKRTSTFHVLINLNLLII